MSNKEENNVLTNVFLLLVLASSLFMFGYVHEEVHQEIYEDYNIESEINIIKDFPRMTTEAEKGCLENECILAHNINDIVGYHLMVILAGIGIILILKNG